MRKASAAMISLLNSETQFQVANLITIIPVGASIVRMTDADLDITVTSWYDSASHTFTHGAPALTFGPTKLAVGLQTDKKTVTIGCRTTDLFAGVPWPAAVQQGLLDNAQVLVEKVLWEAGGSFSAGTLIDFWGIVSQPTVERFQVRLDLASWLEVVLAQNFPRNVYQAQCLNTLFDAGCGLVKATYAQAGTAQSGSTASIVVTGLSVATGFYSLGSMTFTSGVNTGLTRPVAFNIAGIVTLIHPFPAAPAPGDTLTLYPGCDKSSLTCKTKFSNTVHFRGFPVLPSPENAL